MSQKSLSFVARPLSKGTTRQRYGRRTAASLRQPTEYKKYVHNADMRLAALSQDPAPGVLQGICDHCVQFIDTTAAFLSKMTEKEVSLSVKFLWAVDGSASPALHTLFRSTKTRITREAYAPRDNYSYMENTAFRTLLEGWPLKHYYASDDLVSEAMDGKYINSNANWISFYTATCVVSIPSSKSTDALPIGFLCADSYLGSLESVPIHETLESASLHLYNVISVLFAGYSVPESERVAAIHAKGRAEVELLPCGWRYAQGQLEPLDPIRQLAFQRSLAGIEDIYRNHSVFTGEAHRANPGESGGPYALPFIGDATMNYDEEALRTRATNSNSPAAKRWLVLRSQEDLTPDQQAEVIRKLEKYNPEAADMVRGRKA